MACGDADKTKAIILQLRRWESWVVAIEGLLTEINELRARIKQLGAERDKTQREYEVIIAAQKKEIDQRAADQQQLRHRLQNFDRAVRERAKGDPSPDVLDTEPQMETRGGGGNIVKLAQTKRVAKKKESKTAGRKTKRAPRRKAK